MVSRSPSPRSAAIVTRPTSVAHSVSTKVPPGPSMTWSMAAAISRLLRFVEWTSTTLVSRSEKPSDCNGDSSTDAVRGSSDLGGAGSFAISSDWIATRSGESIGSTS